MVAVLALLLSLAVAGSAAPMRIVSAAPSITEILFALGLGDRVVGVTSFCHYPPEAARKPKIGNYLRPNVEEILSLRPDVVFAERSMIRQALQLPSLNLNVIELDDSTVSGIYESIRKIGQVAGVSERAEALSRSIRADQLHPRVESFGG